MWPFSKIRYLERANANLNRRLEQWEQKERGQANQIEYLVRTIREMDDQIFKMAQCSSWEAMRPNFTQLQDGMTSRKVAESRRINDLLRPELIKTYAPKQIESK